MSPEQLRKQLNDYGVSPGPITATTFPVYVRKLNSLRSRNSGVNQELRRVSTTRSNSTAMSADPNLNGFSCDESDAENEDRRNRLSMCANDGVASYYVTTRRNNQFSDTGSDMAPPEANSVRNSSAYKRLSLARPSIRTYSYNDSEAANRYGISKPEVGAVPQNMQTWNQQSPFLGIGNSSAVRAGKTVSSSSDESRHSWQLISTFIVLLVLLFIIVVVLSYCFITRSSHFSDDTRSNYMLCGDDVLENTSSLLKCTSRFELGIIQRMVRELLDALSTRAGDYDCGYRSDARYMSRSEIVQLLDDRVLTTGGKKTAEYLQLIADICTTNDHWGIKVYGNSMDKDFALESVFGKKSLWCRITDSARYIFSVIIMTLLFIGTGFGLFMLIRLRRRAADAERQEVFDLVEKIIDLLRQNAAAAEVMAADAQEQPVPPYLAIPHVRDALIPLHLRRAKQRIWDQAVKFLSANESRVRVEHQQISGEGLINILLK